MTDPLFDLEYYSIFRPAIRSEFEGKGLEGERLIRRISEFAAASGCHIIAAYLFYGEAFGMSEELQAKVGRLLKFYRFAGVKAEVAK